MGEICNGRRYWSKMGRIGAELGEIHGYVRGALEFCNLMSVGEAGGLTVGGLKICSLTRS